MPEPALSEPPAVLWPTPAVAARATHVGVVAFDELPPIAEAEPGDAAPLVPVFPPEPEPTSLSVPDPDDPLGPDPVLGATAGVPGEFAGDVDDATSELAGAKPTAATWTGGAAWSDDAGNDSAPAVARLAASPSTIEPLPGADEAASAICPTGVAAS